MNDSGNTYSREFRSHTAGAMYGLGLGYAALALAVKPLTFWNGLALGAAIALIVGNWFVMPRRARSTDNDGGAPR
jgi:hypothetical protein